MHQAISAKRQLAIVLYYCTIANLFCVSISFVCSCIQEVSTIFVQKTKAKFITIPKGEEVNEVMRIYNDKWQFYYVRRCNRWYTHSYYCSSS